MPLYEISVSGNAWVTTTYRVEADSSEEAERLVRAGEVEAHGEDVSGQEETYVEVEEIVPSSEKKKVRHHREKT
jgi:hypothetical protein